MDSYITKAGDQWDMIAKKIYGNELKLDVLMNANPELLDIYQFDSGVKIRCPEISAETNRNLPPWRR